MFYDGRKWFPMDHPNHYQFNRVSEDCFECTYASPVDDVINVRRYQILTLDSIRLIFGLNYIVEKCPDYLRQIS